MPITFRCTACDRMLSIARRKAGTQVGCPKCGKQILVPATAGVAVESNPVAAQQFEAMPLFERSDFEALLNPAVKSSEKPKPRHTPKPQPTPLPVAVTDDDSGEADVLAVDGIIVTRTRMIIGGIIVTVLLALSFAVGYFLATLQQPTA